MACCICVVTFSPGLSLPPSPRCRIPVRLPWLPLVPSDGRRKWAGGGNDCGRPQQQRRWSRGRWRPTASVCTGTSGTGRNNSRDRRRKNADSDSTAINQWHFWSERLNFIAKFCCCGSWTDFFFFLFLLSLSLPALRPSSPLSWLLLLGRQSTLAGLLDPALPGAYGQWTQGRDGLGGAGQQDHPLPPEVSEQGWRVRGRAGTSMKV